MVPENRLLFESLSFSSTGVYLITGGLGGLGVIFARYLLECEVDKVILLGRSEVSSEKEGILNKLNRSGKGKALYVQCDTNNRKDLTAMLKK